MYDLIIIGTGSMGAAGAYYASRRGLRVLMIDAHHPPHDQGAHHGSTRLFRTLYHNDAYQQLLNRAAELWLELEKQHRTTLLERCGVLNLAPSDSADLHAKRHMADKYRLPCTWLDSAAIHARWPGIRVPHNYNGLYEAQAGYLYSDKSVALLIAAAQQHGAHTAFGSAATRIARHGGTWHVHDAQGKSWQTRKLALSAGTWSQQIAGLGIALPFTPERKTFAWYDAPAQYRQSNGFPGFTVESADGMYYGFPDHGAGLKVGRHDSGEAMRGAHDRHPYGHYDSDRADTDRFLQTFLPQSGAWRDGQVCSYDRTANEDFILAADPDSGLFIAGGFSGHGFKFAPAIGEWIAMFGAGQTLPPHAACFALPHSPQT